MDVIAHALWANLAAEGIGRKKKVRPTRKQRVAAMLGSIGPDLSAFIPGILTSIAALPSLLSYALTRFTQEWGEVQSVETAAALVEATPYVHPMIGFLYGFTHSALLWLVVVGIAYLVVKRVPFWLVGWGTHIGLDVFTHDAAYFPTMLVYPISDFHINATAWSNPVVFGLTYAALLVCYLAVYRPRPTPNT